jgi:alpha-tubulin suppressor-like RCC1 family protein
VARQVGPTTDAGDATPHIASSVLTPLGQTTRELTTNQGEVSVKTILRAALALVVGLAVVALGHQPADAAPLTGATGIGARASNSCAVVEGGLVRCWGENLEGQLGDGTNFDRGLAVEVLGVDGESYLTGATQVVVGNEFACARLANKQVRCWGRNTGGQLGDGTTDPSAHAVVVRNAGNTGPLTNVTQIAAGGSHVCARRTDGQVRCWGTSALGQLGNGDDANVNPLPTAVQNVAGTGPLQNVVQVTAGIQHSCARLANKQVRCWGADYQGQLGNGAPTGVYLRPVAVRKVDGSANIGNVTNLSTGSWHTCAVLGSGQARCWGDGGEGQLGEGNDDDRTLPVVVEHPGADLDSNLDNGVLTGVVQVAAGGQHTCFRLSNDRVRCTGDNAQGQLGLGVTGADQWVPNLVHNAGDTAPLGDVDGIVAGGSHTCARGAGLVQCWGNDGSGQLGNGGPNADTDLPTVVEPG